MIFVNVYIDRPWQDPNGDSLPRERAGRYRNIVSAHSATLAARNTKLLGALAHASLVATTFSTGSPGAPAVGIAPLRRLQCTTSGGLACCLPVALATTGTEASSDEICGFHPAR
jgi:hypothetical protein